MNNLAKNIDIFILFLYYYYYYYAFNLYYLLGHTTRHQMIKTDVHTKKILLYRA